MADELGVECFIPPPSLCTDNAAMAGIALPKLGAGQVAELDLDVTAGLVRPGRSALTQDAAISFQSGSRFVVGIRKRSRALEPVGRGPPVRRRTGARSAADAV